MEVSPNNYHFKGYVTKYGVLCSDGRTITPDAFKHHDGEILPLVWNHQHNDVNNVLGKVLLHNLEDGMYGYGLFNDTESGVAAKTLVDHGDIVSMSICANQLKHNTTRGVIHGKLNEVSLVLAGANPGAFIDTVMKHGEECEDEAVIYSGEGLELIDEDVEDAKDKLEHSENTKDDESKTEEKAKDSDSENEKTVQDVFNEMTEEQKTVVYYMLEKALDGSDDDDDDDDSAEHSEINEGDDDVMKQNVFDQDTVKKDNVLSHADQQEIIAMAKQSNVGSFKQAVKLFVEENDKLQHSEDNVGVFEDYGVLFPEFELLKKGEPETIYKHDQGWVGPALRKIHKSPFSRIRTRFADARLAELKAKGYQNKGDEKTVMGQIAMINRETTPQTIYIKDSLHRDDIVDITDFSIVDYQWKAMRGVLDETMVLSAMIGDGRELDDPDKISEEHIRPIWKDNEEYTIHYDVDIEAARKALQGTNTGANFGDNYIYAEAIITATLYSREQFKGTGTPDFYCTPHLVNVMLLARDLNGRRIYDSKADLAKALNCNSIVEVEQFEGLTRTVDAKEATENSVAGTKKLLGLFVNLNDYTFGSTRGGEITKFEDFDMDFNLKKFMLETRLSGSLYKLKSAIALEEPVTEAAG